MVTQRYLWCEALIVGCFLGAAGCGESKSDLHFSVPEPQCGFFGAERTFELTAICDEAPEAPLHAAGPVVDDEINVSVRPCGDATLRLIVSDRGADGEVVPSLFGEERVVLVDGPLDPAMLLASSGELEILAQGSCAATIAANSGSEPLTVADDAQSRVVLPVGQYDVLCAFASGWTSSESVPIRACERLTIFFDDAFAETLFTNLTVTDVDTHRAQASWTRVLPTTLARVMIGTSDVLENAHGLSPSQLDADSVILTGLDADTMHWLWLLGNEDADGQVLGPVTFTTLPFPIPTVTGTTLEASYVSGTTTVTFRVSFSTGVSYETTPPYGITVNDGSVPLVVTWIDPRTREVTVSDLVDGQTYQLSVGPPIHAFDGGNEVVPFTQAFSIEP